MGNVLLLGGTGAIGRHTATSLADRGHDVYVTSRRPSRASDRLSKRGVRVLQGDAMSDAFVRQCLDVVGDFDAVADFMVYPTAVFRERMPMLLELSSQYVFLSSARVYAAAPLPLTEESPRLLDVSRDARFLRTDEYALAKARQEDLLRRSRRENWTVVRPGLTFADHRLQFGSLEASTWLWRSARGLPVAVPDSVIDRVTTMTWAGDTGAILARLVGNARALGETFQIASDESHVWRDVGRMYAEHVSLDSWIVPEARYFRAVGASAQIRLSRAVDRRFDSSKVLDVVGGHAFTSLRTSLAREVLATEGESLTPDYELNGAIDALTGTDCGLGRGWSRTTAKYLMGRYPAVRSIRTLARRVRPR